MQARKPTVDLAALGSEERRVCYAPSGNGEEARRRVWRVVGVRVGLPRHDMEVEGVVVKDDAVLELRVRCCTCNAQAHVPKRRGHHRVPRVLQCWLL